MINPSSVMKIGFNIFINSIVIIFLGISFSSCNRNEALSCEGLLFGRPTSATGLSDKKCKPECACKDFTSKHAALTEAIFCIFTSITRMGKLSTDDVITLKGGLMIPLHAIQKIELI